MTVPYTVNSGIEARLLFNFWTFEAVLYSSFCQFLFNKSPNFHDFTVFYSRIYGALPIRKSAKILDW